MYADPHCCKEGPHKRVKHQRQTIQVTSWIEAYVEQKDFVIKIEDCLSCYCFCPCCRSVYKHRFRTQSRRPLLWRLLDRQRLESPLFSNALSRTSPGRHSPTFRYSSRLLHVLVDIVVYEISLNVLKNNLSISLIKAKLDIIFI